VFYFINKNFHKNFKLRIEKLNSLLVLASMPSIIE
jgi:hypothetical protein